MMSHAYRMRPVRDAHEWHDCFKSVRQPYLMQSYHFGEAKRRAQSWHVNRFVFERSGAPVAICQVLEKRVAGLRLATRINRGPVFLGDSVPTSVKENVMALVRDHWRWFKGGPLLIAPALDPSEENRSILMQLGFRDRKKDAWCSALLDLEPDEEEIQKRFAPTWRNRLRSAIKNGLEFRASNSPETIEWILDRHVENMRAKKFQGPRCALVRELYQANPDDFLVAQAVSDGQPMAGMVLAQYGPIAEYYIGWFGKAGRKLNCGNFLYWNAALTAKRRGCRWFDLGGYDSDEKYGHFKLGMRGMEYKLIGEWLCV